MDDAQFWSIIEAGGPESLRDPEKQLPAVREQLRLLPPADLVAFHLMFNRKMDDAYHWDLWAAGYLMNGGCSDDGFAYFRAWLISQGKRVYEAALRDPDNLAAVADADRDDNEAEDLWGVAQRVYREKTGVDMVIDFDWTPEPRGEQWHGDDCEEYAKCLPKLAAVYS
jgi:hypothetical protein